MLSMQADPINGANAFCGEIARITDRGSTLYVDVDLPPVITALTTRHVFREMDLEVGKRVCVCFDASSVHVFWEQQK